MNQIPPNLPRLHWAPVEPSWIVSIGLVILAVLPHQIPESGRRILEHPNGSLLFAALSAYVAWLSPVLGAAMFIFLAGIILHAAPLAEHFAATNLNKDRIRKSGVHKWLGEEVLSENPKAIQERTANPVISYDEVPDGEQWHDEDVLGEHPHAIQERAVGPVPEYDEGSRSYYNK